ncbi:MAG: insulinase family protein [Actinobacteria bacterium]|nr:insulinase family protein [Actinomycetota bacterium]
MSDRLRRTVLPNGVRVVSETVTGARSLAVGVWFGAASRDEPAEQAGLSHLVEHLIFKGTGRRDARSLALAFDAVGGEMNAYTAKELTAFHARVPAGPAAAAVGDTWPIGVDLLLEAVTEPSLRPEDLEAERTVILEELAGAEDDPADLVDTRLFEVLFPGHPLGWEVIGREETVQAVTVEDLRAFRAAHVNGTTTVLAAAGVVDHDRLVEAAERWLGSLPVGVAPARSAPQPNEGTVHVRRSTEQLHLALGWPTVGLHDDDRHALAVLDHLLGDGPASRLFQEVRERRGLAYSVGSAYSSYDEIGALTIYAGTAPERVGELLDVVDAEIADLTEHGVRDDELEAAKGFLVGSTLLGLEEPWTVMSRLGTLETIYGRVASVEEQLDRVRAVTSADVDRVARRTFAAPPARASVGRKRPR